MTRRPMTHRVFNSERQSPEWVSPPAWRASGPEGIPSDPELENQINDRISFKKFLNLPLDKSMTRSFSGEPDSKHSTFRLVDPTGHRHFQVFL